MCNAEPVETCKTIIFLTLFCTALANWGIEAPNLFASAQVMMSVRLFITQCVPCMEPKTKRYLVVLVVSSTFRSLWPIRNKAKVKSHGLVGDSSAILFALHHQHHADLQGGESKQCLFCWLIEGHAALCCALRHYPSSVMSQYTHEEVVIGVINGDCSQTSQIKNNDQHLKKKPRRLRPTRDELHYFFLFLLFFIDKRLIILPSDFLCNI